MLNEGACCLPRSNRATQSTMLREIRFSPAMSNKNRPRHSARCMKKLLIVEQLPAGGERVAAGSAPEHQEVMIDRPSNCSHETTQQNEV